MNKTRLQECREVLNSLNVAQFKLERLCDREQDCVSNYPENFQDTPQYERAEEAAENLTEALCSLSDAIDSLEKVV